MSIQKNDTVMVVAGNSRGKTGKVLKVYREKERAIIEGVNIIKRHTKASQKNPQGGIVQKEEAIHVANVMVVCPKCGKAFWNSVASVLSLLAERGRMERFRSESLRAVIFSGDVLPVKYLRKLKCLTPRALYFNVYGQTEANSSMCYPVTGIPEGDGWKIPVGKAFPNFEVFALDDNRHVIERPGEIGELYIRSNSVAMGYWGDPERTAESFTTDPRSCLTNRKVYRTGDLVTIDAERNYLFLGRKDHQVKRMNPLPLQ